MKVFVYKPGLDDGSQGEMPHIGMGIVAAELQRIEWNVTVIDEHFRKEPDLIVKNCVKNTDITALSLVSLEWTLPRTQEIIDLAHERGKQVWIGGPHAQGYWDLMLTDKRITKIIVGEVDGQIEKVALGGNAKVVKLPTPTKLVTPDYFHMLSSGEILAYPLYISRGCTNRCSFCAGAAAHGKWRQRDIKDAIWELQRIKTHHPFVKRVYLVDDAFTADLEHAKAFLRLFNEGLFDYELQVINVRADQLDDEFLHLLSKNCSILPIGVESADETVFKAIGKGETLEDIKKGILKIQSHGITPWLNMIVGLPKDTFAHHFRSVDWCTYIPDPKIVHWFQYAPFRGTRAYDYFLKQGCFEDGFIPSPYGRRYDELPWEPDFETESFPKIRRALAQLYGYLKCDSPVPIVSKKAEDLALQYMPLVWNAWRARNEKKIEEYLAKYVPEKRARGQLK